MAPPWAKPPDVGVPLLGWWDFADLGTTIPNSPGVVSGVVQVYDKSSRGWHMTQTTVGNQPRTGRTVNGLNVLDFVTDDYLSHSLVPIDASMTMFGVMVQDTQAATGGADAYAAIGATGVGLIGQRSFDTPKGWFCYAGGPAIARTTAVTTGTTEVVCCKLNGANSVARRNGVAGTVTDIGTATDLGLIIGNTAALDGPFDGAICELILYDAVLPDVDCQKIEAYLTDKWVTTPSRIIVRDPTRAMRRVRRR